MKLNDIHEPRNKRPPPSVIKKKVKDTELDTPMITVLV